jgi:hypothetical protein
LEKAIDTISLIVFYLYSNIPQLPPIVLFDTGPHTLRMFLVGQAIMLVLPDTLPLLAPYLTTLFVMLLFYYGYN